MVVPFASVRALGVLVKSEKFWGLVGFLSSSYLIQLLVAILEGDPPAVD